MPPGPCSSWTQFNADVVDLGLHFSRRAPLPPCLIVHLHVQDAEALEIYADMVHQVKAFRGLEDRGLAHPPKIIIAERPQTGSISQRVLTNAREVAAELLKLGYDAQVLLLCPLESSAVAALHDLQAKPHTGQ